MNDHAPRNASASRVALVAAVVGVVLAGLLVVLALADSSGGPRASSPLIGELVPPVEATVLTGSVAGATGGDGDGASAHGAPSTSTEASFSIDDHRGRWVLVNFFASWCVPCEQEHPELVDWLARQPDERLIVAVPFGDSEADAVAFAQRLGMTWPVVADERAQIAVDFGVLRPPETFLVAPTGVVAARWQGQVVADDLDAFIDEVLERATESRSQ